MRPLGRWQPSLSGGVPLAPLPTNREDCQRRQQRAETLPLLGGRRIMGPAMSGVWGCRQLAAPAEAARSQQHAFIPTGHREPASPTAPPLTQVCWRGAPAPSHHRHTLSDGAGSPPHQGLLAGRPAPPLPPPPRPAAPPHTCPVLPRAQLIAAWCQRPCEVMPGHLLPPTGATVAPSPPSAPPHIRKPTAGPPVRPTQLAQQQP